MDGDPKLCTACGQSLVDKFEKIGKLFFQATQSLMSLRANGTGSKSAAIDLIKIEGTGSAGTGTNN